eukprot:SAG11_NODE_3947_length_2137_cov_1.269382_4_plen_93_part_01
MPLDEDDAEDWDGDESEDELVPSSDDSDDEDDEDDDEEDLHPPCSPGLSYRPERHAARFGSSSSSCTCEAAIGAAASASLGAGRSEDLLPPIP